MLICREGAAFSDPDRTSASIKMVSAAHPGVIIGWQFLAEAVEDGWKRVTQPLKRSGQVMPMVFSLKGIKIL